MRSVILKTVNCKS